MERREFIRTTLVAPTVLFLGSFTVGCSHDEQPKSTPNTELSTSAPQEAGPSLPSTIAPTETLPINEADAAERQKLVQEWLGDVQKVVDTTQDEQAKSVFKILQESAIGTPQEQGVVIVKQAEALNAAIILPLVKEDAKIAPQVSEMINNPNAAAFYNPDSNVITLIQPTEISPTFRAILALHEGNHNLEFKTNPYDWQDSKTFTEHEFSTHQFENRIIAEVGGQAYSQFIDEYSNVIAATMIVSEDGTSFPARGEYNSKLDTIFEPAISKQEENLRQTHIWIDAVFRACDKEFGADAERHKLNFLLSLYQDSHTLPS